MIFIGPHLSPEFFIIRSDHPTFTTSTHDLILAKTPGTDMANAANRTTFINCTMRLCAILDHLKMMTFCQHHNRIHIARPASEMHTNNRFCFRCENFSNGFCSDIARVRIHICKNWFSTGIHHTRNRSNESSWRHHDFIARPNS